jgi:hypothetical protein
LPYKKGKKVETGIWHLEDKKGVYLAEVNYVDPHSGNRVRRREVAVLRNWRTSTKTDAIRREISRERGSNKNLPFKKFADEYLKNWAKVHKRPSSYSKHSLVQRASEETAGKMLKVTLQSVKGMR